MNTVKPPSGASFGSRFFLLLLLLLGILAGVKYWYNQPGINEKQYLYNRHIADSLFAQKAYNEALNFYQTALTYKPNDRYAIEQLKVVQANLNITFLNTFGGAGIDEGNALTLTPDGGYLIVGSTASWGNGKTDAWILKTDAHGQLERRQTAGADNDDVLHCLTATKDNQYFAAGTSKTQTTSSILLLQLNAEGRILSEKYISSDTAALNVKAIAQHPDSTLWLAGYIQTTDTLYSEALLLQINQQAEVLQVYRFGNNKGSYAATAMAIVSDTTIALAGYMQPDLLQSYNGWVALVKTDGTLLWQKNIGGDKNDVFTSLALLPDGRITAAGHTHSFGNGSLDLWVAQFNPNGTEVWKKVLGENGNDAARSIIALPDAGFAIAGYTNSYGQNGKDIWLLKLFRTGNLNWKKEIGDNEDDTANALITTPDGGFAICGSLTKNNNTDLCIVKTDANGQLQGATDR